MIQVKKINNYKISVSFQYSQERVNKIKKIKGRKWDSNHKYWIIPYRQKNIRQFIELFNDEDIKWDESLKLLIQNNFNIRFFDKNKVMKNMQK